jgi:hypothetical protein
MTQLFSPVLLALAVLATLASASLLTLGTANAARTVPSAVRCYLGAHGDASGGGDASGWTCVTEPRSSAQS